MLRWLGDLPATTAGPQQDSTALDTRAAAAPTKAPTPRPLPKKVKYLDELARAGLPVPRGFFLPLRDAWLTGHELDRLEPGVESAVRGLLARGPVIVRSALAFEDDVEFSGAGLGRSVRCTGVDAVVQVLQAQTIDANAHTRIQTASADDPAWVLIQAWCDAESLCVVFASDARSLERPDGTVSGAALGTQHDTTPAAAVAPLLVTWVELHAPSDDTLSQGRDPLWAGPTAALEHPGRDALEALTVVTLAALSRDDVDGSRFAHGCELEVVLAGEVAHAVQARPLSRDRFVTRAPPRGVVPDGLWRLDVDHNPARLSAGHAWVIEQLQRGRTPDLAVLDGWLYERLPNQPRVTARASPAPGRPGITTAPASRAAIAALHVLLHDTLPKRMLEAASLVHRVAAVEAAAWPRLRDEALLHIARCVEDHAALASVRRSAGSGLGARQVTQAVLARVRGLVPTAWDIAAPLVSEGAPLSSLSAELAARVLVARDAARELEALGDTVSRVDEEVVRSRPASPWTDGLRAALADVDEFDAKSCLVELDDLLYAVGQLPLRTAWLRGAELAGLSSAQVFELDGDALAAAVDPQNQVMPASNVQAPMAPENLPHVDEGPPAVILWRTRAYPSPAFARARLAVGESFDGTFRRRTDLHDLQRRPCGPGDVVWLPTLLPQAALILHDLGVRAVVTAYGGASSHGARMAWELHLTALLGVGGCPALEEGDHVHVDVRAGAVTRPASRVHE